MPQSDREIVHVVLFKWKEDATPEAIEAVLTGLRGMAGRIEGMTGITCGENFSSRAQGFTHGLVAHFTDRAALETYATHPVHVEVVENYIHPIRGETLAFDYEA
jgi:hypothetical protein